MPEDKKKVAKKGKTEGEGKAAPKKQFPLTEEEKVAQAKVEKCEKQIEEQTARLKEVLGKLSEKDNTRYKLRQQIFEHRDAIKKIQEQVEEKKTAQNDAFNRATKYIDSLRKRKNRRADERAELQKLLPHDAQLPPIRGEEEGSEAVNDYDRAIKIVQNEIERLEHVHATTSNSVAEERKLIGAVARWTSVIDQIKALQEKAAAPLAELAEVDVMACLETCRKLKDEIRDLQASTLPHYDAIADACKKIEENRAEVPKLIQSRTAIFAQMKEIVARLHEAQFEFDNARFKAQHARNEKRRADALQESAAIKARLEEAKKNREARIEKAMNTLPHEREVAVANQLLGLLRSVALPGTCGISESAGTAKPKAQPTLSSAPAVELEEASFGATTMVVSRKNQPIAKVGKKQNKKKKAAAAEPKSQEPKKKSKEDPVRVAPMTANLCEELSLKVPENYGEVEETYNAVKEKLEGFEKIRAMIREQREKDLQEAEKKAEEEAAKKEEEKAKAKAEAAEKAAKEAEEPAAEEKPATEEPASETPAEPAATEPATESQ